MLRIVLIAAVAVAAALPTAAASGVGGPAFYVDGVAYRTVATPTDLSGTGAPDHSFDTIYDFGGLQLNVATAAPGDRRLQRRPLACARARVHELSRRARGPRRQRQRLVRQRLGDRGRPRCGRGAGSRRGQELCLPRDQAEVTAAQRGEGSSAALPASSVVARLIEPPSGSRPRTEQSARQQELIGAGDSGGDRGRRRTWEDPPLVRSDDACPQVTPSIACRERCLRRMR